MNCEQVEERLSAYLDNMLAPAERRDVTVHLQTCSRCMDILVELGRNDNLLAQLPRVDPTSTLHERLFALAEVRELSEALGYTDQTAVWCRPNQPHSPLTFFPDPGRV